MKSIAIILMSLLLMGCPMMGGRGPVYSPADAVAVNDKVCIFIKAENLVAEEKILSVSITRAGDEKIIYAKQFYSSSNIIDLNAGKCIGGISQFNYERGYSYRVDIMTPKNHYQTSFIIWKYGNEIKL